MTTNQLSTIEARVIGCLLEKQITTPDQYPLSLNALTNACNQKSNRTPLMELAETEIQSTLDGLIRRHLVLEKSGFGSRVPKYQHRFCNTEFSDLQISEVERAIVCELLLRGPQTVGELRTRAARMATINDAAEVEAALDSLAARPIPLVAKLPREHGQREQRYVELFSAAGANTAAAAAAAPTASATAPAAPELVLEPTPGPEAFLQNHADNQGTHKGLGLAERVTRLERTVAEMAELLRQLVG